LVISPPPPTTLFPYTTLFRSNYNRNYLLWNTHYINSGNGQAPDAGYVVQNNTLTKANFTGQNGTFYGIYDQISRPDESADSSFVDRKSTRLNSSHLGISYAVF